MAYSYQDLRDFVRTLEQQGELRRVKVEVDPELELAEITDRVCKRVGPALLFERVKGSNIPLLINAFGSPRRMALALGVESLDELAARITEALDFKSPEGLIDKLRLLPKLAEMGSLFPKSVRSGPCKEVILREGFSLSRFPIIKCWPEDAGCFITLPLVFSKHPETGRRNVGVYRMQLLDDRTTAMHWQIHKHGAEHHRQYRRERRRMEVAVALGCDPAVTFAAVMPAPEEIDELMLAGFIRRRPVELVKCETVDLEVPANAEIVLEGYVDPDDLRTEGPFGDHTGFYSLADRYPAFHVTCITHRRDPIYQTIIVGRPPQEDCWMGKAIERLVLPIMRKQLPEVVDINMPFEGVFHNLIIVSIKKSYPGHARKIMNAIWGLGQAMLSKCIVVVDDDTDVQDVGEVAWKVLNNIDPERDIQFVRGPIDVLDHASRLPGYGSKMGIDATRKWPEEGFARPWPNEIKMSREMVELVSRRWHEYGIE